MMASRLWGVARLWAVGVIAAALVAASVGPAPAAKSKRHHAAEKSAATSGTGVLGKAGAWTAYATKETSGKVCYLVGTAKKSEPAKFARKAPMAMVTHRPAEHISNVVSMVEGTLLKAGSDVTVTVDDHKYDLFTKDDAAWARTSELDRTIVEAFVRGREAVVKGIPAKGPPTTDIYSLSGFTKALTLIDKACDIKHPVATPTPTKAKATHKRKAKATVHHRHRKRRHHHR